MSEQGMQGPDGQDGLTQAQVDARIEAMTADLRATVDKLQAWATQVQEGAARQLKEIEERQKTEALREVQASVEKAERKSGWLNRWF